MEGAGAAGAAAAGGGGGGGSGGSRRLSREESFEIPAAFPGISLSQGSGAASPAPGPTTEPPSFWSCCVVPSKIKTIQLQKKRVELHITNIALQCSLSSVRSVSLRVFTHRVREGCLVSVLRPGRVDQCKVDLTFFPSDRYVRLALEGVEGSDGSINNPSVVSLHLSGVMSSYELLGGGGVGEPSSTSGAPSIESDSLPSTSMNPLPLHGNMSGSDSDAANHSDLSEIGIGNSQFENEIMNAVAGDGGWDSITHSPKQGGKRGLRSPPNIASDPSLYGQSFDSFEGEAGSNAKSSQGSTGSSASSKSSGNASGMNGSAASSSTSGSSGGASGGGNRNSTGNRSDAGSSTNSKKKPPTPKKRHLEKDDNGRKTKRSKSDSPKPNSSSPPQKTADGATSDSSKKSSGNGNSSSSGSTTNKRSAQTQAAYIIAGGIPESAMRGAKWRSSGSGLKYRDVAYGQGVEAKAGSKIKVRYTGRLHNSEGKIFDQNIKKGMKLTLGLGRVIQGWDFGLLGVRAGGIRQLLIPSNLAYGRKGVPGKIPSNTPLYFEVQISSVR
eukprot:g1545.t1